MSWAETMISSATVALHDRATNDEGIFRSTQPTSWDPYEVWLTRVKQPRDRAAQVVTASASNPTLHVSGSVQIARARDLNLCPTSTVNARTTAATGSS
jgi:hypothetical protein